MSPWQCESCSSATECTSERANERTNEGERKKQQTSQGQEGTTTTSASEHTKVRSIDPSVRRTFGGLFVLAADCSPANLAKFAAAPANLAPTSPMIRCGGGGHNHAHSCAFPGPESRHHWGEANSTVFKLARAKSFVLRRRRRYFCCPGTPTGGEAPSTGAEIRSALSTKTSRKL